MNVPSVFQGQGIQHSGAGNLYIGGNVNTDLHVTDPCRDKDRIQATKGGLLEASYHWVLSQDDFLQWRRDDSPTRLLWIRGDPGKGKTMLMCGIIDELEKSTSACHVAYFFCQATDERLSSATSVLRGLLYMLICRHPELACHLEEDYSRVGKLLFDGPNAWVSMVQALTAMLAQPSIKDQILVVDALDECTKDMDMLVKLISGISHGRWVVSSRNWPVIEDRLAGRSGTLRLELNADSVATAVKLYIEHQVGELSKLKRYNESTREAVRQHLVDNADGTFLWAALVSQQLAMPQVRKWHTLDTLKKFPPGLEGLYERMMDNVFESIDAELCREILAIASLVVRPLTMGEMMNVLDAAESLDNDLEALGEIIAFCGSFLTVRDDTIFFVHQSAKDFLLNQAVSRVMPNGTGRHHGLIFTKSVQLLQNRLKRQLYSTRRVHPPPTSDPLSSIEYFVVHLMDHFQHSDAPTNEIKFTLCHEFLKTKFLNWLEALGHLESVPQGVLAMQNLDQHIGKHAMQQPQLVALFTDALRFIRANAYVIAMAPDQVYFSALLFSPSRSTIKQLYASEVEGIGLTVSPPVEENWSPCLMTMEGHTRSITAVKYTADGRIVSLDVDGIVKMWDSATGVCLQTCCVSSRRRRLVPCSVAFRSNGQMVVGSRNGLIRVYDFTVNRVLFSLRASVSRVSSIAAGDNGVIVSGHEDGSVIIWKHRRSKTLRGHRSRVSWLDWGADGTLLTISDDGSARTWDPVTGECKHATGTEGAMGPSCVLPDGRIVSGRGDGEVVIRDPLTGETITTLEGHTSEGHSSQIFNRFINAVAVTLDGKLVASSVDRTMRVWDLSTERCTHLLLGHGRKFNLLAFAPDGRQLASVSNDRIVKIWDVTAESSMLVPEAHESFIGFVRFTPKGNRVVSMCRAGTVKVWNARTGACVGSQAAGETMVQVRGTTISSDGALFASGPRHPNNTRVMDPQNNYVVEICDFSQNVPGEPFQLLGNRNNGPAASVLFSPDRRRLATGYDLGHIDIWDITSGECLVTLKGHRYSICSMDFTSDGLQLASGSYDDVVKVWDTESGECLWTLSSDWIARLNQVYFMPIQHHLLVGWSDGVLHAYDLSTGTRVMDLTFDDKIELLSFDPKTTYLQTNLGFFHLSREVMLEQTTFRREGKRGLRGLGLSGDHKWILRDGRKHSWLPAEYRPMLYSKIQVDIKGCRMALGCRTGRVIFYHDTLSCSCTRCGTA